MQSEYFHLSNMFRKEDPRSFVDRRELLGMGSFGAVYKGIWLNSIDKEEVAVKVISYNGDELSQLGRELYFLKNLNSPFIVKYVDSFISKGELWIVMELCDSGSLLDICQATKSTLTEPDLRACMACCIRGLLHIHERRSIHRDIKAGNILLSSRGKAMLSDFGVSTQLTDSNRRRTVIGTPYWMAPEILQETSYGENADIWSLGITIIECAQGQPPYFDAKPLRAMYMIASKPAPRLADEDNWSEDMIHFLDRCLQKDPYSRATSAELALHPWLQTDLVEIDSTENEKSGAALAILRILARNSQSALEGMRRQRQESSDTSTLQTFTARVDDVNTIGTDTIRGGTWKSNTIDTEVRGVGASDPGTWRTAANTFVRFDDSNNSNGVGPESPSHPQRFESKENNKLRMSKMETWNASSFNNPNESGMLSEISTPENTIRPGRQKSGVIDTLRNQLGTIRINQNGSSGPSGTLPYNGNAATMRTALDAESRNTLRNQLSSRSNSSYKDDDAENSSTLRKALDPVNRAALQSQLARSRAASAANPSVPPDVASQYSIDSTASTQCNERIPSVVERTSSRQQKLEALRTKGDTVNLKQSFQYDFGSSTATPVNGGIAQNSLLRSFTGEAVLADRQNEPVLAVKKFDSSFEDISGMMPLAPCNEILSCQEGSLSFDRHEIQFKMAIYGADGRSTGCRMEVKFGNVGGS